MPTKRRLRVSDVYIDSDNESINDEFPPTSLEPSKLPAEAYPKTGTIRATVLPTDICTCSYNCSANLPKKTEYRHVGTCQSDMDEDEEIRVQFLMANVSLKL